VYWLLSLIDTEASACAIRVREYQVALVYGGGRRSAA
jgi:hypothetical protein